MNIKRFLSYILVVALLTACGSPQPANAATNAQSIQFLLSQVRNASGPLSGGKVYAYAAGTTTPKTMWTTRGKTVIAANPYTLDSLGTAQLYGDGLYHFVITTSAGVTVYDRDFIAIKDVAGLAYDLADYASLAAAVAAIGSTPATLQYSTDQTVSSNLTIPSNIELMPLNGAVINYGAYNISYAGSTARWPKVRIFNGTGLITFGIDTDWEYPEWRGAVPDAQTDGSGTDSTVALQASFNSSTPTWLSGQYLVSNLTLPNVKTVDGPGIHVAALIAKTGSTGTMLTEATSATKITLRNFAMYGRNQAYTGALKLGYTSGGINVFGTEGMVDNVWVRDFPAGFPGIDVNGNVGHFGRLMAQSTGGIQIVGAGNMVGFVESMQSKGFPVTRFDTTVVQAACNFQDTLVSALEVEATDTGVTPVYLKGNTKIGSLWLAPTAGATYPAMVELDPSCTTWAISNVKYYFQGGTAPTVTGGNFKSGTDYFGGNASAKSYSGEGNFGSDMFLAGRNFYINKQKVQGFVLRVATDGTAKIQHKITASGGAASNYAGMISGASAVLTDTPTGADASTAFAAGAKISSATPSLIVLNTNNQVAEDLLCISNIILNTTGTPTYTVNAYTLSININGVTQTRLAFQLSNTSTGAVVSWATALGTSKTIDIQYLGFLK